MNTSERTSKEAPVCANGHGMRKMGGQPVSRVKHFAGLSLREQVLLLRALLQVSAIRLGLFLLPFRILQRLTRRQSKKSYTLHSVGQYIWAVRAVSRYVPGATCLTQALAAQALLSQSGHESHIEFGVRKDEQRRFLAHAWLVSGDQVVIGGAAADGYVPLEAWKATAERMERL